ncbi:ABC transporter ATP-binding protein [Lactobacillus sp. ESL0791]|uniref:ATP-binding cassette domain-containing protein n=1 Tax=Lactobacillus sp. ESL0791 TaxID=2983234 RepID=UPI0023F714F3|nr:ABC transporter ATP-binding protein [Lactobacillus sp. ESL0791]MDF7638349.1 ABC transporter ATP-binding protein [Lactobacillus sp. ESL0791]
MSFKGLYSINKPRMIALLILEFITSGLVIGTSYLTTYIFTFIRAKNWHAFLTFMSYELVAFLLSYLGMNCCQFWIEKQIQEYNHLVRKQLVKHYFYDNQDHPVSQLQNRLTNDLNIIKSSDLSVYTDIPYYLAQVLFAMIGLFSFHWSLLIAVLILALLNFKLPQLLRPMMKRAANKLSQANKSYLDTTEKWLNGLAELQNFMAGKKLSQEMAHASENLESANVKRTKTVQALSILNKATSLFLQFTLLTITAYLITKHMIIFGVIATVQRFSQSLTGGFQMLTNELGQISSVGDLNKAIKKDRTKLSTKKEVVEPATLSVTNLSYQFKNGKQIAFPDFNIKSNDKVLILGPSGSGKSTLFQLLGNKINPDKGQIIFKDKNGSNISPEKIKIGYIPQEPVLFPASISDNITMFDHELEPGVKQIVADVYLKDDLDKFANKLATRINLNNLNVSGGQRQKIVLARTWLHEYKFVLLDEATSAIDQATTEKILQRLCHSNATILFIAHNLSQSSIKLFDQVIRIG